MLKFTSVQVFEKIKAQLGQNQQISDRTINDTLETLMPFAGEETELDAFVISISKTFTSMDGNLRKEVADKAKALEEAAKVAVKTPEQIETERLAAEAKAKADADEPAWAKAARLIQEQKFADLEARLSGAETVKNNAQKREDILTGSKGKFTENVIKVATMNFDFSKETAATDFDAACNSIGEAFGIKPQMADAGNLQKPNYVAEIKRLQSEGKLPPTQQTN